MFRERQEILNIKKCLEEWIKEHPDADEKKQEDARRMVEILINIRTLKELYEQ